MIITYNFLALDIDFDHQKSFHCKRMSVRDTSKIKIFYKNLHKGLGDCPKYFLTSVVMRFEDRIGKTS